MRKTAGGTLRMDVVMYCLSALNLVTNDRDLCKKVTFEIALLGQHGLCILPRMLALVSVNRH